LKDPLLHFVILGMLCFAAWYAFNPAGNAADPGTIEIDRAALVRFVQFRTRSFDEASAERRLAGFSDAVFEDIVDEYVREEALHRAALEMGLGTDDYVIRQRLVQKVEYMAEGVAAETPEPDESALRTWFSENAERYREAATVTFAHVFFDSRKRDTAQNLEIARRTRDELNRRQVSFSGATAFGDRFPYHVNYVERRRDEVESHFGQAAAEQIFALAPDAGTWQGPLPSELGSHLVLLTASRPSRIPGFAEVKTRVGQDWMAKQTRARKDAFVARVVEGYRVVRAPDLRDFPAGLRASR